MTISKVAKSKIFIGSPGSDEDLAAYEADTYVEIGSVEDLGEFGDTFNEITFAALGDARLQRYKGVRDAGVIDLVVGRDPSDPGQAALKAALNSEHEHRFHIIANDAQSEGGDPSEFYFKGLVMSARNGFGTVDNIVRTNVQIAINSDILEVVAS